MSDGVAIAPRRGCQLSDTAGRDTSMRPAGYGWSRWATDERNSPRMPPEQIRRVEYIASFLEFADEPAIRLATRLVTFASRSISLACFRSGSWEAMTRDQDRRALSPPTQPNGWPVG